VFEKAMTSGLRILVADDNPLNLEEACELLKRLGVAPKLAVDGVQAVALARQQDFDLILMDLQMPLLDGLGATKQIRDHEHTRSRARVPVLAYTSHALEDGLLRDCGVDGVLHKPCSESALQECVIRWCGAGSGTPFGAAATADMPSPR
jgi:CheY-like chemotaxis protein